MRECWERKLDSFNLCLWHGSVLHCDHCKEGKCKAFVPISFYMKELKSTLCVDILHSRGGPQVRKCEYYRTVHILSVQEAGWDLGP